MNQTQDPAESNAGVTEPKIRRVVFFRGQIIAIEGVRFKVSKVNDDVLVLRPLAKGVQIKRK